VKACDRGIEQVHELDVDSGEISADLSTKIVTLAPPGAGRKIANLVVDVCLAINDIEILVLIRVVTENRPDRHDAATTVLPPIIVEWIHPVNSRRNRDPRLRRHNLVYEKSGAENLHSA